MSDLQLHFDNRVFSLNAGETVLDCLLRRGIAVPHGCRAGACQSCAMILDQGRIAEDCQRGLSTAQRQRGLFLSCLCIPGEALSIHAPSEQERWLSAEILEKQPLSPSILRLRLAYPRAWQAGQYFTLSLDGQLGRCYSAANSAGTEPFLELQLRHFPGGEVSAKLWGEDYPIGSKVFISPGLGDIQLDDSEQDLLIISQGTGLAPAKALLQQAANNNPPRHRQLIAVLSDEDQPYWEYCSSALAGQLDQSQRLCYQGEVDYSAIEDYLLKNIGNWRRQQIYLFGSEGFVERLQRICALAGASRRQLYSEAFLDCNQAKS